MLRVYAKGAKGVRVLRVVKQISPSVNVIQIFAHFGAVLVYMFIAVFSEIAAPGEITIPTSLKKNPRCPC